MFRVLDCSASTSTSYSILFWGIIQICIWGYYLVLFWETASSPFCSVQSLDLEPDCGGFKTCPQILRHSYSWMLEHNSPPLKCGLTLVTLFKWTEWGDSRGVWLLRLLIQGSVPSPLNALRKSLAVENVSCHVMRTHTQPYAEVHVARTRGIQPLTISTCHLYGWAILKVNHAALQVTAALTDILPRETPRQTSSAMLLLDSWPTETVWHNKHYCFKRLSFEAICYTVIDN